MSKIDVERHVIYAKLYAFFCLFILIFHTRNFIFRSLVRSLFFWSIAHSGIQLACIYKIHSHYCSLVIACIVVARFFFISPISSDEVGFFFILEISPPKSIRWKWNNVDCNVREVGRHTKKWVLIRHSIYIRCVGSFFMCALSWLVLSFDSHLFILNLIHPSTKRWKLNPSIEEKDKRLCILVLLTRTHQCRQVHHTKQPENIHKKTNKQK